jgi:hypothetical protein
MKHRNWVLAIGLIAIAAAGILAQMEARKPASPPGTAAAQFGGKYVAVQGGQRYEGGKWIEVTYSRPIKRGRQNLFGAGADYGKALCDGAPVWRVGANQTTRLKTEIPLVFDGKTLAAGEYSVFVDLKENGWTLIFSNWPAQEKYDPNNKDALWGSYGYTPDKDALRASMKLDSLPFSMEQFTIAFIDVTADGGKLALMWDKTLASAPFKAGI